MTAAKLRIDVDAHFQAALVVSCGRCGLKMRKPPRSLPDDGRVQCFCGEVNNLHTATPAFSEILLQLQQHQDTFGNQPPDMPRKAG